ncbi:MAG: zinc-binding dehydrogenase [Planctomycetes bacterium]|nr:zinc-binding dehydrogenase [Planctomycetota bacterium]
MNVATAMVLEDFGQPLRERQFPLPKLSPGEVLVKTLASGVCGSDVHMWLGQDPRTPRPIILGHESCGEIVEVGGQKRSVDGEPLTPGRWIFWNRGVVCGACYFCAVAQQPALCPNRWVYGIHKSCKEPPHLRGGYADHILLDARTDIFLLDRGKSPDPAVLVSASCSGATAANAVELAPTNPGDVVLVQGPGPLGVFLVAFARQRGAREVIVIGGTDERLRICERFGGTVLLNRRTLSASERKAKVLDFTAGRGVDVAYEAVGTADAVEEGVGLIRSGGRYALVGFGQPGGKATLDCYSDIVRKNLQLQGVWVSHTRHTHQALSLVLNNLALFATLVTHRFPLLAATAALQAMHSKQALKAVLLG